jgi:hypothetical protein
LKQVFGTTAPKKYGNYTTTSDYDLTRGEYAAFARETGHSAGEECGRDGFEWKKQADKGWQNNERKNKLARKLRILCKLAVLRAVGNIPRCRQMRKRC